MKIVLFWAIQFTSIWSIDRTLLPLWAKVKLGTMAMKGYILQHSSITGTSPSDCLVSYPGHSLWVGRSWLSAELQLVYSTAPTDRARYLFGLYNVPLGIIKSWYVWFSRKLILYENKKKLKKVYLITGSTVYLFLPFQWLKSRNPHILFKCLFKVSFQLFMMTPKWENLHHWHSSLWNDFFLFSSLEDTNSKKY